MKPNVIINAKFITKPEIRNSKSTTAHANSNDESLAQKLTQEKDTREELLSNQRQNEEKIKQLTQKCLEISPSKFISDDDTEKYKTLVKKLRKRTTRIDSLEKILDEKNAEYEKQMNKLADLKENIQTMRTSNAKCNSTSHEITLLKKTVEKMTNQNLELRRAISSSSSQEFISVTMTDSQYSRKEYKKKLDSIKSQYQDLSFENKIMREKIIDAENDVFIAQSLLESTKMLTTVVENGKKWDSVVCKIEDDFYRQQRQTIKELKFFFTLGEQVTKGKCHRCSQNLAFVPTVTLATGTSFCLWCHDPDLTKFKNFNSISSLSANARPFHPEPAKESINEIFSATNQWCIVPWYTLPYMVSYQPNF